MGNFYNFFYIMNQKEEQNRKREANILSKCVLNIIHLDYSLQRSSHKIVPYCLGIPKKFTNMNAVSKNIDLIIEKPLLQPSKRDIVRSQTKNSCHSTSNLFRGRRLPIFGKIGTSCYFSFSL